MGQHCQGGCACSGNCNKNITSDDFYEAIQKAVNGMHEEIQKSIEMAVNRVVETHFGETMNSELAEEIKKQIEQLLYEYASCQE